MSTVRKIFLCNETKVDRSTEKELPQTSQVRFQLMDVDGNLSKELIVGFEGSQLFIRSTDPSIPVHSIIITPVSSNKILIG